MRPYKRDQSTGEDPVCRGVNAAKKKPYALKRKMKPERFSKWAAYFMRKEWVTAGRYTTVDRAIQGYEGLMKSSWNWNYDYRIETPVGYVTLPVVKA